MQQEINLYIIIGVILLIFSLICYLIEHFDKRRLKAEQREYRHRNDYDKQLATDEIESAYYELGLNKTIE